jgi:predicted Zn-ribbon and HTH transcriptional regulator
MERNREGYLVSETQRECTQCGVLFERKSKTVTLCNTCNSSRVKEQSPEVRMYRRAKARAQQSGLPFTITKEDIKIPTHCPVLGVPLEIHKGSSGGRNNSPALDRVDNSKGYEKGNVLVISHLANMMKSSASVEELIKFSQWVQDTYVNTAEK